MKKKLELSDFLNYRFLSRLTASPAGTRCAFIVSQCDYDQNTYLQDAYIFERRERKVRRLTNRGNVKFSAWLDENTLLVNTANLKYPSKNGKAYSCYCTIDIDSGDEREYLAIPMKVKNLKVINRDQFVILADYHMNAESDEELAVEAERNTSYLVYDEIPFRRNGRGYCNKIRSRLYIYDRRDGSLSPVSDESEEVEFFSLEAGKILYSAKHYGSRQRKTFLNGLAVYDIESRTLKRYIDDMSYRVRYSGIVDGKVIFAAADGKRYGYSNENPYFWYFDEGDQTPKIFFRNEQSARNSVGSDSRYGANEEMVARDGGMYYVSTRGGDSHLFHAALDGRVTQLDVEQGSVDEFAVFDDEIIIIAMRGNRLGELYAVKDGKEEKLTSFNDWVVEERTLSTPVPLEYENEGNKLDGYVMKPVGFEPGKKYPCILTIHGGHKTAYGTVFYHEMQCWANNGFFVIYCNPRGSDGRDNEFADMIRKAGVTDYSDIMRFTDVCCERIPEIDSERIGVTGGSYGGFMTNWIVGQTNRFKCAVSQRSISNWIYHFGASDTGYQTPMARPEGNFWEDTPAYWDYSPLKYAHLCVTPTLFIHSDEDYRCPVGGAEEMFTVLQFNGIESRMCVFRGENHELSRSGKPRNRLNRLKEISSWIIGHLQQGVEN